MWVNEFSDLFYRPTGYYILYLWEIITYLYIYSFKHELVNVSLTCFLMQKSKY